MKKGRIVLLRDCICGDLATYRLVVNGREDLGFKSVRLTFFACDKAGHRAAVLERAEKSFTPVADVKAMVAIEPRGFRYGKVFE